MNDALRERLLAAGAGLEEGFDPAEAFVLLLAAEGAEATLDDRVALEAAALGSPVARLSADAKRRAMLDFFGHRWQGFEIVGEDRGGEPIVVVPYDPSWPAVFAAWKRRLSGALGSTARHIEHVGSTAVPGLAAKPIVDIQISVADLENEDGYVPAVGECGVALRSRDAAHRYFRPPPGRPRDVHVHVCALGEEWEREHLLFRDYLRAHDDVRDAYAALKRELAVNFAHDRLAYTEGKGEFIRDALGAAGRWAIEVQHVDPAK